MSSSTNSTATATATAVAASVTTADSISGSSSSEVSSDSGYLSSENDGVAPSIEDPTGTYLALSKFAASWGSPSLGS